MQSMNRETQTIKRLILFLIASGILNIAVLFFLFYWCANERLPVPYFEYKPANRNEQLPPLADSRSSLEVINQMKQLSFEQLISKLNQNQMVENGISKRDLALASLVAFHQFDLQRSLAGHPHPVQKRTLLVPAGSDKKIPLAVFPGLTDEQYEAVIRFAKVEKWPLTNKGMFLLLQKQGEVFDKGLLQAFYFSKEFLAIDLLFSRASVDVSKEEIFAVLKEGSWRSLKKFALQQKALQDLSEARRQKFLLDYIEQGSSSAAYLLLKTDGEFAGKKLDDRQALTMLNLLTKKNAQAEKFALELLTGPRSVPVWKKASERLYGFNGKQAPLNWSYQEALAQFAPERLVTKNLSRKKIVSTPVLSAGPHPNPITKVPPKNAPKLPVPNPPKEKIYVVQQGDSLWKIAKRFHTSIKAIKRRNHLKNDLLKPGAVLNIPLGSR